MAHYILYYYIYCDFRTLIEIVAGNNGPPTITIGEQRDPGSPIWDRHDFIFTPRTYERTLSDDVFPGETRGMTRTWSEETLEAIPSERNYRSQFSIIDFDSEKNAAQYRASRPTLDELQSTSVNDDAHTLTPPFLPAVSSQLVI
jgi:hypothetical protein